MRRRDVIKGIVGSAGAWPLATSAQQRERLRRVALLIGTARNVPGAQDRDKAFLEAFEQLGWTNGRNVQIEFRWSEGNDVTARKYADELLALAPDVVLATGGAGAAAGHTRDRVSHRPVGRCLRARCSRIPQRPQ